MLDLTLFANCEAHSPKGIELKLLRAFVAGEKLKHFDREDALRVLDELIKENSMSWQIGYADALASSLKEEEELMKRFKELQTCPACGLQYTGIEAEDKP